MLHVRVVCPATVTGRLVDGLAAVPGVENVVVVPGAAARPGGDAVQLDVLDGSANRVLRQLREFGLERDGSVVIHTVDAAITDPVRRDARERLYRGYLGERAPVWDLVEARIRDGAKYAPSFFLLLMFAGIIGACGILTNSQILIVGAMVVGPEYNAIIAVSLGVDRRDRLAVGRGLLVLIAGFLLAIAVTLIFALCIRWLGRAPRLYQLGIRPVSDLINSPNLFSVVVAVVAGLVGVISLTLSKTGALLGVFISITTIPAAADIGVSAAFGAWGEAGGSAEQLVLNAGLLIAVGALGLRTQRLIWRRWPDPNRRSPRPAGPPGGP